MTVVQLVMAIVGACAYNADDNLYPELDEARNGVCKICLSRRTMSLLIA